MIDIPAFSFIFLFLQYIVGAVIIITLSVYMVHKFKVNSVVASVLMFGATIVIWDVLVFFHRIATTPEQSAMIFRFVGIVHPYIIGFYFLILLNIWKARKLNLLCLAPAVVGSIIYGFFLSYEVFLGTYGWSFQTIIPSQIVNEAIFVTTVVYMSFMIITLIYLLIKSPSREIRLKFLYILAIFIVFQAIGMLVTNLWLIPSNPNFPPLGGIFQLLSYITLSYSILSPPKKEMMLTPVGYPPSSEFVRFIQSLYSTLLASSSDTLGSKYFKFRSYLTECGLVDKMRFGEDTLLLDIDEGSYTFESKQIACLIDTSLKLLENNELDPKFIENLVSFINSVYNQISVELIEVFKKHENYIKNSEILYHVANSELRLMFAPEGFNEECLEKFSSSINSTHNKLRGTQILYEFSTDDKYLKKIKDFVIECLANGERAYVFTKSESLVHLALKDLRGINYFFLSPSASRVIEVNQWEEIVPVSGLSQILGVFMVIKNSRDPSSIVFDNLTDFLLLTSFTDTYKMARHVLDMLVASHTHSLFLINRNVHDKPVISAFRALYNVVI